MRLLSLDGRLKYANPMKLLNYRLQSDCRAGVLTDKGIADLTGALPGNPRELVDLMRASSEWRHLAQGVATRTKEFIPLSAVTVLAPVLRPGKFLGAGGNFRSHIAEVAHLGLKAPTTPIWFNKQTNCVNGPFDPIIRPYDSEQLDYEGELGVVIGRRCRRVPKERAYDVIAGFVVCNDVSVRDWQLQSPTSTMGKSFDSHGPFGPYLVTPEEVADPGALCIRTWVNGELRQEGSTEEMIFGLADLIADLTGKCTLDIGDVLTVGSPAGVGGLRNPPQYLKAGDVVRVEVEGIGSIENPVIEESATNVLI